MKGQEVLFSKGNDEWSTPNALYDRIAKVFPFTLDAAANHQNAKCLKYYSLEDDALNCNWDAPYVWLNPPYSKMYAFMNQAYAQSCVLKNTIVCLVAARTDTKWWHERAALASDIIFLKGRVPFSGYNKKGEWVENVGATFPSALVIYKENFKYPLMWHWDWKNEEFPTL